MSAMHDVVTNSTRWRSMTLAAIIAFFAVVFAATADYNSANRDVYSAGVGAWRIAESGSPWLDDVAPTDYDVTYTWLTTGSDDHVVVARSPGVIAAGLPAYRMSGFFTDGFSLAPQALSAAAFSALGMALFYLALQPRMSRATAVACTLAVGLGTPVWSIAANGMWTHTLTVPGILGMAAAASRDRWWLVGVCGGVALWGRLHVVVIVAAIGLSVAFVRRQPMVAVAVGVPSLMMLGLASAWSHWHYGTWSPSGAYNTAPSRVSSGFGGTTSSVLENQLGLWFSPDRGFLVWTPVVLLLIPAIVRSWRSQPDWARVMPVAGLAYTLIQGQLNTFTGGDGFYGYRHTLELLCCLAPCCAYATTSMGRVAKRLLGPVVGLQVAAFTLGSLSEGWYVVYTDAWRDNSLALAVRTEPVIALWLLLMVVFGALAGAVWRQRIDRGSGACHPRIVRAET